MKRGVIAEARDLAPLRHLNRHEALALAEQQARRVLEATGTTLPAVPDRVITDLPRVKVRYVSPFPASGAAHWLPGHWSILINAGEPPTRQRFSLAHEFKHILDHPFVDVLYGPEDTPERSKLIEQVCDYFAGCLLVPEPWLRDAWDRGVRELPILAAMFNVSPAAIATRLGQTGIAHIARHNRGQQPGSTFVARPWLGHRPPPTPTPRHGRTLTTPRPGGPHARNR